MSKINQNKIETGKANSFVGPVGMLRVLHARNDEIITELEIHNTPQALIKSLLANTLKAITYDGISNYATTNNATLSRDGIAVFSVAGYDDSGTLLLCASEGATTGQAEFSGSASFSSSGTASNFVLGESWGKGAGNDPAFSNNFFVHVLDNQNTFAYSSGDTLTVNWTVSITS